MPIRPFTRDQVWLLPPTMDDLVPSDHVVRFVATYVESLDMPALGLRQAGAVRGGLEYNVRVLLAAWLYGFMIGIRSTRRLELMAHENLPMIWLLGGQRPDHSTLARFLQANRQAMKNLFKQTVHTAVQVGLVGFAFQAIDGTRVANVSRDKALTRRELLALGERVEKAIEEMERGVGDAEQGASAEDTTRKMPKQLTDPVARREQIRVALAELDRRAQERKNTKGPVDPKTGERVGPPVHLADPEAVMMKGRRGYIVGYNAQAAVDAKDQVIVAAEVVASSTDNEQQIPMLQETEETAGRLAEVTVMDGGYHSATNVEATQELPTDLYVADPEMGRYKGRPEKQPFHKDAFLYDTETDSYTCPQGQLLTFDYQMQDKKHGGRLIRVYRCHTCLSCAHYGVCTRDHHGRTVRTRPQDQLLRRHREKMSGDTAKAYMKQRSAVVEPVFGILKEQLGLTRFLRRGLTNVRAEWHLLCAAYNLRKLWKHRTQIVGLLM